MLNIVDVVLVVNYILSNSELSEEQINNADINADAIINVIDIVALVNIILGDI